MLLLALLVRCQLGHRLVVRLLCPQEPQSSRPRLVAVSSFAPTGSAACSACRSVSATWSSMLSGGWSF